MDEKVSRLKCSKLQSRALFSDFPVATVLDLSALNLHQTEVICQFVFELILYCMTELLEFDGIK